MHHNSRYSDQILLDNRDQQVLMSRWVKSIKVYAIIRIPRIALRVRYTLRGGLMLSFGEDPAARNINGLPF